MSPVSGSRREYLVWRRGSRPRGTPVGSAEGVLPPDVVIRAVPRFDRFYADHFRGVVALTYALSGSRLAAEDLAQEAFVAAYRRWGEVAALDNPAAWVRRVAANHAVSAFRRRMAEARALARLSRSSAVLDELSPDAADVWRAVRRLPRRQAQAVALFYLQDLSLSEVAEVLDCSVETVRTHLRRAPGPVPRAGARSPTSPQHAVRLHGARSSSWRLSRSPR